MDLRDERIEVIKSLKQGKAGWCALSEDKATQIQSICNYDDDIYAAAIFKPTGKFHLLKFDFTNMRFKAFKTPANLPPGIYQFQLLKYKTKLIVLCDQSRSCNAVTTTSHSENKVVLFYNVDSGTWTSKTTWNNCNFTNKKLAIVEDSLIVYPPPFKNFGVLDLLTMEWWKPRLDELPLPDLKISQVYVEDNNLFSIQLNYFNNHNEIIIWMLTVDVTDREKEWIWTKIAVENPRTKNEITDFSTCMIDSYAICFGACFSNVENKQQVEVIFLDFTKALKEKTVKSEMKRLLRNCPLSCVFRFMEISGDKFVIITMDSKVISGGIPTLKLS